MAASSPALSNNSSDTAHHAGAAATAAPLLRTDGPPRTLRGLNKPKCTQCGNVARSRCPYFSCKSCCSKAQNPCHIHVLKPNTTFSDKTPASTTPLFDQQLKSTEVTPAVSSHRIASLRQLSSSFSQFNNVHSPLRSRKPLTRKEAAGINEWRFSKLKEYKDRNVEVENEAFDRYMQNVSLLEEVLSVKSIGESSTENKSSSPHHTSPEYDIEKMVSEQKLKLRSNPIRIENIQKRMQEVVDEGLRKLQKCEINNDVNAQNGLNQGQRSANMVERALALREITDKLSKARNEEDLKSCLEMKTQLFGQRRRSHQPETKGFEIPKEKTGNSDSTSGKELDYLSQKLFRTVEIDQEALIGVNRHFSSLEQIEDL